MEWPEPIQRVQCISESGIECLPSRYIRPDDEKPTKLRLVAEDIPIVDLSGLYDERRNKTVEEISDACKEWGFFQVINHGVSAELLMAGREVSREFFRLPLEEKQKHANDPQTYVGYGSRTGVQKGAILDWGDYFFHHFLPLCIREEHRWPSKPEEYRTRMKEYCEETLQLCRTLLSVFSENLGLPPDHLNEAFGREDGIGICVRANYYPVCPQPELTYGLFPHSDPGGITILLQDDVVGLQVRKGDYWVPVPPVADALTINLGDQMEILTNGIYRSVEHSCVVNQKKERMSIAVFCNPDGEKEVGPIKELIHDSNPPRYRQMTFNEYKMFIRTTGPKGKRAT
jgi:isopenicillin N synthase-like dioxygenase